MNRDKEIINTLREVNDLYIIGEAINTTRQKINDTTNEISKSTDNKRHDLKIQLEELYFFRYQCQMRYYAILEEQIPNIIEPNALVNAIKGCNKKIEEQKLIIDKTLNQNERIALRDNLKLMEDLKGKYLDRYLEVLKTNCNHPLWYFITRSDSKNIGCRCLLCGNTKVDREGSFKFILRNSRWPFLESKRFFEERIISKGELNKVLVKSTIKDIDIPI